MNTPENVSPRVSILLNKTLNEQGLTRSDFIRKFHAQHGDGLGSRNHLFKILNGQAVLGEHTLLPLICKTLGLDLDEAIKLVRADKITKKEWGQSLPKANKVVQEIAMIMEQMPKRDQDEVLKYVKTKANLL